MREIPTRQQQYRTAPQCPFKLQGVARTLLPYGQRLALSSLTGSLLQHRQQCRQRRVFRHCPGYHHQASHLCIVEIRGGDAAKGGCCSRKCFVGIFSPPVSVQSKLRWRQGTKQECLGKLRMLMELRSNASLLGQHHRHLVEQCLVMHLLPCLKFSYPSHHLGTGGQGLYTTPGHGDPARLQF